MWILALDVGTSSIRAIGYDALGRALPGAAARIGCEPATTHDGGSELDPEELVAATALAIDRCVASAPGPPAAVGASVFWHSLLGLSCAPIPTVTKSMLPRELARVACTTALWGPAYLERIASRQETPPTHANRHRL